MYRIVYICGYVEPFVNSSISTLVVVSPTVFSQQSAGCTHTHAYIHEPRGRHVVVRETSCE